MKIPFISQTYTKAVAISFRQSHTRTRNLVKYHLRVVFTENKMRHEICLNTAKYGSTVKSAPQLQEVLLVLESTTVNGEIIGVNHVAFYLS